MWPRLASDSLLDDPGLLILLLLLPKCWMTDTHSQKLVNTARRLDPRVSCALSQHSTNGIQPQPKLLREEEAQPQTHRQEGQGLFGHVATLEGKGCLSVRLNLGEFPEPYSWHKSIGWQASMSKFHTLHRSPGRNQTAESPER